MTNESLGNLLAVPFEGRIVRHDDDPLRKYSDFIGEPTVVYPWTDAGLRHAIGIKQHLGDKGFLRSGVSSSGDGSLQGQGGIVVDFSCFTRIDVARGDVVAARRAVVARTIRFGGSTVIAGSADCACTPWMELSERARLLTAPRHAACFKFFTTQHAPSSSPAATSASGLTGGIPPRTANGGWNSSRSMWILQHRRGCP